MCSCESRSPAPTALPPAVVSIAQPIMQETADYVDFTGRTEAADNVDIRPRVGGYLEKVFFKPGQDVKQGDTLFEIDRRPYKAALDQAEARLQVAEVKARQALIEYNRVVDLFSKESATELERDRQTALRDAANADVLGAKANLETARLDYEWSLVVAPLSGRISRNYVDSGNLIQGGTIAPTLLTNIVSIDPIFAYFDADERTVLICQQGIREGRLKSARAGENSWPVYLGLATEQGYPHEGRIDFAENKIDAQTGTLRIRGVFPNPRPDPAKPPVLAPGLFVRIRLPLGEPMQALQVSERALGQDQGQRFALVVNDKNIVEYRRLTVGRLDRGLRVINDGLKPGDWVIVNGLQRVRPGVTVAPQRVDMRTLAPPGSADKPGPAATSRPSGS